MSSLDGKVALVTGAGGMKGIGRATALKLASLGADIVLTDARRAEHDLPAQELKEQWRSIDSVAEEVEALGRRCLKIWCDLTISEQIQSMVNRATEHYGHIDILVNNARALLGKDRAPITELSEEVWHHFFAINTTAVFLNIKYVGRVMMRQGRGGRIINIGSDAAKRGKAKNNAYNASKFAMLGLTQASALDLAPYGITVNAVCPGAVNTIRLNYWERQQAEAQGIAPEEYRTNILTKAAKNIPVGRVAEPEEIASLVAFLASDDASFITGQAYNINGGVLFH